MEGNEIQALDSQLATSYDAAMLLGQHTNLFKVNCWLIYTLDLFKEKVFCESIMVLISKCRSSFGDSFIATTTFPFPLWLQPEAMKEKEVYSWQITFIKWTKCVHLCPLVFETACILRNPTVQTSSTFKTVHYGQRWLNSLLKKQRNTLTRKSHILSVVYSGAKLQSQAIVSDMAVMLQLLSRLIPMELSTVLNMQLAINTCGVASTAVWS